MNTKCCIYRDCGNTSLTANKITFFGFPIKDAEKCQLWTNRAGCDNLNLKNKYLCENHFSHIYISRTVRRTVLLPNAVPFCYDEHRTDEQDAAHINDSKDDLNDEYTEATIEMLYNADGNENGNTLLVDDEKIDCNKRLNEKDDKDLIRINRPSYGNNEYKHVTKRQKLHTSSNNHISPKSSISPENPNNEDDEDGGEMPKSDPIDNTIDNPDITTFIYKGEEYIQMPKRVYLKQRAQLDLDLKRLRGILRSVKGLVNNIE